MDEKLIELIPVIVGALIGFLGAIIGAIIGGLIGFLGAFYIFKRQAQKEIEKERREKLEEFYSLILSCLLYTDVALSQAKTFLDGKHNSPPVIKNQESFLSIIKFLRLHDLKDFQEKIVSPFIDYSNQFSESSLFEKKDFVAFENILNRMREALTEIRIWIEKKYQIDSEIKF